jgi:hypothetical protein
VIVSGSPARARGGAGGLAASKGRAGASKGGGAVGFTAPGAATEDAAVPTPNTVRHTEQRARTPPAGTFAGSTRKTVWQLGHVAFIVYRSPSGLESWRRSNTNTEPGSVLA